MLCYGQIVGGVIAENREIAQKAAAMVNIEYEELPAILTIEVKFVKVISIVKTVYTI